ncbi:MAG: alpha-L-fucosidase [Kiritimatiellia bacterium]
MTRAKIPVEEYEQLANQFNPVKFDAGEWAQLAQDAGMKYLVFVAKHHDGFAMFDSKADPYNIVNRTPWKRDPVRELSEACRRRGLTFCVYYSHNLDWHDPHATASRDLGPGSERDFSRHMNDKALPQIRELLTQYGPMGLVWFDMSGGMKREQAQPFADLVGPCSPTASSTAASARRWSCATMFPRATIPFPTRCCRATGRRRTP